MKDFYSPKEVSQILQVHEKTVRRYLREGVIHGQKIGGNWRVSREVLTTYMDAQPKKTMDEHLSIIKSKDKSKICLRVDIKVENAKEGHKHAKLFMNLISESKSCNFQYQMEGNIAQYLLCGNIKFLHSALDLLEESGVCYE